MFFVPVFDGPTSPVDFEGRASACFEADAVDDVDGVELPSLDDATLPNRDFDRMS